MGCTCSYNIQNFIIRIVYQKEICLDVLEVLLKQIRKNKDNLVYMEVIFLELLLHQQIKKKENEKIIQKWQMKDWQQQSEVNIQFTDYKDEQNCLMVLSQKNIPDNVDKLNLKQGWMTQVFDPIRIIMGYPILEN